MRRRWVVAGLGAGRTKVVIASIATLALVASTAPLGAAYADPGSGITHTYVVHGTVMPLGMQFSYVGCQSLVSRTSQPLQPTVALGPGTPPLGTRSLGYALRPGSALGSLAYVPSVGTTPASIAVYPAAAGSGPDGVAYVGYRAPHQAADRMWIGQTSLDEPAGSWSTVDASTLTFTWSEVAVASGLPVSVAAGAPQPSATVGAFTAQHGDGAGFFTIGFGCNGVPFNIDALRVGSSIYDLEGLDTSVSISGSQVRVHGGQSVTLTGSLRDSTGAFVPGGVLVLEQQVAGGDWTPLRVLDASTTDPTVTVTATATTAYRFSSLDRPLAPAAQSAAYVATVTSAAPKPSPSPTPSASPSPSASPTAAPTRTSTPAPKPTAQPAPTPVRSSPASAAPRAHPKAAVKASPKAPARPSAQASVEPSTASKPSAIPTPSASSSPAASAG